MKSSHLTIQISSKKLKIYPSAISFANKDHPAMRAEIRKGITSLIKNDGELTLLAQGDNALNTLDPKIELSKNPLGFRNPLKPMNRLP